MYVCVYVCLCKIHIYSDTLRNDEPSQCLVNRDVRRHYKHVQRMRDRLTKTPIERNTHMLGYTQWEIQRT